MTEIPSTNIIDQLETTKKQLENEIKQLNKSINDTMNSGTSRGKDLLDNLLKQLNETINGLKSNLDQSLRDSQTQSTEQLLGLKESLNGQINSLRGYANSLVEDEESRLVSALETSLTSLTDMNTEHTERVSGVLTKITTISEETLKAPVLIAETNNARLKDMLTDALKMEREVLSKSLLGLQSDFREEIASQIERVFMGVTITKETLNGIIKDTLSRLEENLRRLNDGIDENFTNEIGKAQDIIHDYEGKLLSTLDGTKDNYDEAMVKIVDNNASSLLKALDELKSDLNTKKKELKKAIDGLDKEQQELLNISISDLGDQIGKSKAQVIESHGILKDELEKLLVGNTESIKEIIDSMKINTKNNSKSMHEFVDSQISRLTNDSNELLKNGKKEVESLIEQVKRDSVDAIEGSGTSISVSLAELHRQEKLK